MRINCQSCGAKYSIADEKVRGRTVKIRCKKCGEAIVVRGDAAEETDTAASPAASPQAATTWMLSLADGRQLTASEDDINDLVRKGEVDGETYAWKDGMVDWVPVAQLPELASLLQPAQPSPSVAPWASDPPPQWGGHGSGRPDAQLEQDLFGSAGQGEARVRPAQRPHDLFASGIHRDEDTTGFGQEEKGFTAERGENSVLFTIDALRAGGESGRSSRSNETSDTIDLGLLTASPSAQGPESDAFLKELMHVGGDLSGSLAPPSLPTTAQPPPPEPKPQVVAAPAAFSVPPQPQSNKGLIIGLAAGGGVVGLIAVAALVFFVVFRSPTPDSTSTANNVAGSSDIPTASATAKPDQVPADAATVAEPSTQDAQVEPVKEDTQAQPKDDKTQDKKDDKTPDTKDDKTPNTKDDKTPDTKDDKKDEPPKTADAPFNRGAAIAALSAAAGSASGCKKADGPTGRGRVRVTFANSGRVTSAVVTGPPFAGTSVGGCVASVFRRAKVPPFSGNPVSVGKSFTIN